MSTTPSTNRTAVITGASSGIGAATACSARPASSSAWDTCGRTLGPAQPVVTGFQNADGSRWGRSVDAVPGPDASIYLTDDTAGLVYRLTPAGQVRGR